MMEDYFESGLPRVVEEYHEEDDILRVMGQNGHIDIVWSDRRIKIDSRYDTHTLLLEWREKEYEGDPRPPKIKSVLDYFPTREDALSSAYQEQNRIWVETGEEVPIQMVER